MSDTRIAVVGIGAIGGTVAADLADLGRHELVLCARTPFDRLEVERPGGRSVADAAVFTDPGAVAPADWVLLATKAYQSAEARPWLVALRQRNTTVAILQNGVDHVERVAPLVPASTSILPVVVQLPAEKRAPGQIVQENNGALIVPEGAEGTAFAELFEGARTRVVVSDDFLTQAWWKLVSNAAVGGVCALTGRELGAVGEEPLREVVLDLMREVVAVGRAEGARLPDDAPQKALERGLRGASTHWPSIAVDRREGRPMEWEVRNAVVGRIGRRHGIATPLNDAVTAMLRATDEGR